MILAVLLTMQVAADTVGPHDGRDRSPVAIPRFEADITIDGILDEEPWSGAARLTGFSQYEPVDGRPAEERTEVRVWYSPSAIHFGIIAWDSHPDAIRSTVADRDNLGDDDNVTIYLDTFNDRRRAYFFTVNPLGSQEDGVRSEGASSAGNIFGGTIDKNPDFLFDSKGRRTVDGFVVEVRIPFKSLRYPGADIQTWGINVRRQVQRTGYVDTWTGVLRANASFLAQAGTITGMHDLHRGVVVEAQPFITATALGTRATSGQFERDAIEPSAGVNLKLGFTNMTLDATLNPDFSQVESDAGLITVNERFDLFIPEQRPFFLDGIELFATPSQLVYTRRIVDPVGGLKLTGKFGRLGVAWLTALDQAPLEHDAFFNIARVRTDIGASSTAGVTYTDRIEGDDYNRVLAADARIIFARLYYAQAQFGQSWTRDAAGTRHAPVWLLETDRTGRSWGFNYKLQAYGDGFETLSGFVPRSDFVEGSAFNRLSFYGAPGAAIENFTTFFGLRRLWYYDEFLADGPSEGQESVNADFRLRGAWNVGVSADRSFVDFNPADYQFYTDGNGDPFVPPSRADNLFAGSVEVATPVFRRFDASASFRYGEVPIFAEASEGLEARIGAAVNFRPTPSIRIGLTTSYSRITRSALGGEFARVIIPRLRVEYQPTRALFFRFIGEYRSEWRAGLLDAAGLPLFMDGVESAPTEFNGFQMNWLAALEPSPGTVAYFGYGSSLTTDRGFTLSGMERLDDGFFLKLAYLFRR